MSYLDSAEASILYRTIAQIIKQHQCNRITDVGCRTGELNRYLTNYDYYYYGFDTSEEPVEYARAQYPKHCFEVRDWDNLYYMSTDLVVFSSVLIYNTDPAAMFERVCDFYKVKRAIVHEVNNNNTNDLPYMDLNYFNRYEHTRYDFDLNIPVGHRTILDVQYK